MGKRWDAYAINEYCALFRLFGTAATQAGCQTPHERAELFKRLTNGAEYRDGKPDIKALRVAVEQMGQMGGTARAG